MIFMECDVKYTKLLKHRLKKKEINEYPNTFLRNFLLLLELPVDLLEIHKTSIKMKWYCNKTFK